MIRAIAFLIGAWCCYCAMIGSYDGSIALLIGYVLTAVLDPFELHVHKKGTTAANSRTHE